MLRRICSKCNGIIDGDPVIEKEYADAVLVVDDEIAIMFDDLCDKCKSSLLAAVSSFKNANDETPRPAVKPQEEIIHAPTPEEPIVVKAPKQENNEPVSITGDDMPLDVDRPAPTEQDLPNQVTKRFPVKIVMEARE